MPETLTYTYTSEAEIQYVFSVFGTTRRLDLNKDGVADIGVIDQVVNIATDEINLYCESMYEPSDMSNNLWIRRQATYLACYHLSKLRGHPAQFEEIRDQITQWLEKIHEGSLQVPRLSRKYAAIPCVTNYVTDWRYRTTHDRVIPAVSTGEPYGTQKMYGYLSLDAYF